MNPTPPTNERALAAAREIRAILDHVDAYDTPLPAETELAAIITKHVAPPSAQAQGEAGTPRSDAIWRLGRSHESDPYRQMCDFARQLERELAEAKEEHAELLARWNDLVGASGSPTHGGAVGHVAALKSDLAAARAALHQCYAATGEEAGDIDDFRALVDRERHTVEAVEAMRKERDSHEETIKGFYGDMLRALDGDGNDGHIVVSRIRMLRASLQESQAREKELREAWDFLEGVKCAEYREGPAQWVINEDDRLSGDTLMEAVQKARLRCLLEPKS